MQVVGLLVQTIDLMGSVIFRHADLFDISKATDIHSTKFNDPAYPIVVNGALDSSIAPATCASFLNYLDELQLARFGVHNGELCDIPRQIEPNLE
jgi:hypothetical protein